MSSIPVAHRGRISNAFRPEGAQLPNRRQALQQLRRGQRPLVPLHGCLQTCMKRN